MTAPSASARGGGHGGGHRHGGTTTFYYVSPSSKAGLCIGDGVIVGDAVRLPGGSYKAVSPLRGKSGSCSDPEYPIRADLVALADFSCMARLPYNSEAGIELPEGWVRTRQAKWRKKVSFSWPGTTHCMPRY